jgi:hypothetical protein
MVAEHHKLKMTVPHHTFCIACNVKILVHGEPSHKYEQHDELRKYMLLGCNNPIGTMVVQYTQPDSEDTFLLGVCNYCAQRHEFHEHCHILVHSKQFIDVVFARCSLRRLHDHLYSTCQSRNMDMPGALAS